MQVTTAIHGQQYSIMMPSRLSGRKGSSTKQRQNHTAKTSLRRTVPWIPCRCMSTSEVMNHGLNRFSAIKGYFKIVLIAGLAGSRRAGFRLRWLADPQLAGLAGLAGSRRAGFRLRRLADPQLAGLAGLAGLARLARLA